MENIQISLCFSFSLYNDKSENKEKENKKEDKEYAKTQNIPKKTWNIN